MNSVNKDIGEVGDSLIEHARDDASTSRRGIIEELFPYIVQASNKMSARAITRFLEENHGVKISYVTIGRALRNPKKYWNLYFDSIERPAWIVAQSHDKPLKDFISEPDKYQEMLEGKPVYVVEDIEDEDSVFDAKADYENAVAVLDEKWFCFDKNILVEAKCYIYTRLCEKRIRQNGNLENEQE
ncbi:MAG TPA: hypothetical protein VFC44_04970 [Candidatus Saccharimonadales bacterium]|nr:hypothetical protein [Candidatus Saccharimonadales bacterium]